MNREYSWNGISSDGDEYHVFFGQYKQMKLCEKVNIDSEKFVCNTVGVEADQCDRYRETIYLLLTICIHWTLFVIQA